MLNVAKLLKKTISKHNLLAASPESAEAHGPKEHIQLNGHASSPHTNTNGHTHPSPEKDACSSTHPDLQADPVNQKHSRKKDSCSLATVTEEIGMNGETEDRYCWKVQILAIYLRFMLFLRICGLDLCQLPHIMCNYFTIYQCFYMNRNTRCITIFVILNFSTFLLLTVLARTVMGLQTKESITQT